MKSVNDLNTVERWLAKSSDFKNQILFGGGAVDVSTDLQYASIVSRKTVNVSIIV